MRLTEEAPVSELSPVPRVVVTNSELIVSKLFEEITGRPSMLIVVQAVEDEAIRLGAVAVESKPLISALVEVGRLPCDDIRLYGDRAGSQPRQRIYLREDRQFSYLARIKSRSHLRRGGVDERRGAAQRQ